MAVHHVDVDPLRVVPHEIGAGFAQGGEVGTEDGGGDDGGRRHCKVRNDVRRGWFQWWRGETEVRSRLDMFLSPFCNLSMVTLNININITASPPHGGAVRSCAT